VGYPWPRRFDHWDLLTPGAPVDIVKQGDDGVDIVRYPGVVIGVLEGSSWVEIEAHWTAGTVVQGPLTFEIGDVLREFFSWEFPGNAFSVFTPGMRHKGWYANVTWPSWVDIRSGVPTVIWRDLILDVVAGPNRVAVDLDDEELEASGLRLADAALHDAIIDARRELHVALAEGRMPFREP
jgi:hypothetical protein